MQGNVNYRAETVAHRVHCATPELLCVSEHSPNKRPEREGTGDTKSKCHEGSKHHHQSPGKHRQEGKSRTGDRQHSPNAEQLKVFAGRRGSQQSCREEAYMAQSWASKKTQATH